MIRECFSGTGGSEWIKRYPIATFTAQNRPPQIRILRSRRFHFVDTSPVSSASISRSFLRLHSAINPAAIAVERAVASKRVVESIPSPITQNTDSRHGD